MKTNVKKKETFVLNMYPLDENFKHQFLRTPENGQMLF
ncbi:hypothetical protein B0O79_2546 [Flavobacteriaceae bacterium MAR_2009_75]|nr:hypothetical protein B0O79_2546 [Flavobacteriaceae bacterium MAR_2009_75]